MAGKHGGARPGAGRKSSRSTASKVKSASAAAPEATVSPEKLPQEPMPLEQVEGVASEKEIAILARSYSPAAIKRLAFISQYGNSEAAAVAASNALLDRGFGRRAAFVDPPPPPQPPSPDAENPTSKKGEQLDLNEWAGILN
ncbi:MAG: hypothetical protein WDN46_08110 [Methylocella sp.]